MSFFNIYILALQVYIVLSHDLKHLEEIAYNKAWLLLALKLHDIGLAQPALSEIPLSSHLKKTSC